MNLQKRITYIEMAIAECDKSMLAITKAANVELPEYLTGVSLEAWEAEYKNSRYLYECLQRINSILDSAEKYLLANYD
jgi:hypothetical protein